MRIKLEHQFAETTLCMLQSKYLISQMTIQTKKKLQQNLKNFK